MSKLMEFNFNTWVIPPIPDPPAIVYPYYPDLSGNNYHLNHNYGNSFQAGDGPPNDSSGYCINASNYNTFFGSINTIDDSNFDWGLLGTFSVFWCMKLVEIHPFSGYFSIISNYANSYPFWNVFVNFTGSPDESYARASISYEEVDVSGIQVQVSSKRLTFDYSWHTYCITVDRTNGTSTYYMDAVEQSTRSWDVLKNINVLSDQHEIFIFGSSAIADYGHLSNGYPINVRFDGTEVYDEILDIGDIQTLHSKYM